MKKINYFLIAMIIGVATVFTSCAKDEEIIDPNPSIDFKGGATYTSTDVTIKAGESILVGINAAQNSSTKKKLTKFTIVLTQNNTPSTLIDETMTSNQEAVYSQDFNITFNNEGTVKLVATIIDSDNKSDEVFFNVTVEPAGVVVKKKTNVELGSFNDAVGSFYSTSTEEVFTVSGAFDNQAKVDIIFFKGVTYVNALAAPDDADVNTTIPTFQLNTWTTKNQTRFIKSEMTAAAFDAIGTTYDFPDFGVAASSKATLLVNGDVVYFKTQAGKRGFIKVVDLYSRGDLGKFDVIVEE
ncbi:MAG: hypothetical protein CVT92_10820 [Bacteroidetes bacterium HGW-Bacteroidetes-1]|jgi:hypothetical protein|nr:MAG: hypothetical protein CVT92_10820 [Bacteroidetes bacterium HGW-Bacteroidetes-1]